MSATGLIYSLVSRGNVVLAEFATNTSGNYITVSRVILEKISPTQETKESFVYGE